MGAPVQGFLGINYNTGLGFMTQLTINEVTSSCQENIKALKYEYEFKKDPHYTAYYVHHILWLMCGFFNILLNMQELWDGAYGLSSLSEKTRKSSRL